MIVFITAIAGDDDSKYQKHLKPTLPKDSISFVIGGDGSIANKYNQGISKYNQLENKSEKDIICFVHDDVRIADKFFVEKLEVFYNSSKTAFRDVALSGVIGSLMLGKGCFWWEHVPFTKGMVVQYYRDAHKPPTISRGVELVTISQVLSVDGLAMFVPQRHLDKVIFDESYGGYHFYDTDTCVNLAKKNLCVYVLNIMLEHYSEGDSPTSPEFLKARTHFIEKYKLDEKQFPIRVKRKNGQDKKV